jgi:hypothetical protein
MAFTSEKYAPFVMTKKWLTISCSGYAIYERYALPLDMKTVGWAAHVGGGISGKSLEKPSEEIVQFKDVMTPPRSFSPWPSPSSLHRFADRCGRPAQPPNSSLGGQGECHGQADHVKK